LAKVLALTIDDYEDNRIGLISEVAPRLAGNLLDRGLAFVRDIENDAARLPELLAFIPVLAEQKPTDLAALVREIRHLLVILLEANRHESRHALLSLLAMKNLLAPPIVSESTINAIVEQIVEICIQSADKKQKIG